MSNIEQYQIEKGWVMADFLVVGQGSMGKRRVRCLLGNKIPAQQITVFDTRSDRLAESQEKYGVRTTDNLDAALNNPDCKAVLVSVPGFLHMQYCLAAVRAGKHWFSEIPLSVNLEGSSELFSLTQQNKLIGAVGCQVLFNPVGRALHKWANDSSTGGVLAGSYALGTYLPEWHPYEDYRKFYASNMAMGGGNLDVIAQELTWIRWIIGHPIVAITCRSSKVGKLELAEGTPDHQELIVEFANKVMISLHFDLNDRTHERTLRLCGENSTAKWSSQDNGVRFYNAEAKTWSEESLPENFDWESCYVDEIGQFMRCIETGQPWVVKLDAALEIVRMLLGLQISSRECRTVRLADVRQ